MQSVTSNKPIDFSFNTTYLKGTSQVFEDGGSSLRGNPDGGIRLTHAPLYVDSLKLEGSLIQSSSPLHIKTASLTQEASNIQGHLVDFKGCLSEITSAVPAYSFKPGQANFSTLAKFDGKVQMDSLTTNKIELGDCTLKSSPGMLEVDGGIGKAEGSRIDFLEDGSIQVPNLHMMGETIKTDQPRLSVSGVEDFRLIPKQTGKKEFISLSLFSIGQGWSDSKIEALQLSTYKDGFRMMTRNYGSGKKQSLVLTANENSDQITLDKNSIYLQRSMCIKPDMVDIYQPLTIHNTLSTSSITMDGAKLHTKPDELEIKTDHNLKLSTKEHELHIHSEGIKCTGDLTIGNITLSQKNTPNPYTLVLPKEAPTSEMILCAVPKHEKTILTWKPVDMTPMSGHMSIYGLKAWQPLDIFIDGDYTQGKLRLECETDVCLFIFTGIHLYDYKLVDSRKFVHGSTLANAKIKIEDKTGQMFVNVGVDCTASWALKNI